MAVTLRGSAWTTTAGNKTVTATPAVGDLIVVIAGNSGRTTAQAPTITDNNAAGTYAQVKAATKNASADSLWMFVRNALVPAASSTIFTMAPVATDTGGGLIVLSVTGVKNVGSKAVVKSGSQDNQAAGTPSINMGAVISALNAAIGAVLTTSNSSANTAPPTGWSESADAGYNTPPTGIEVAVIASGETLQTIAWTAATATAFASMIIELAADPLPTSASGTGSAGGPTPSVSPSSAAAAASGAASQAASDVKGVGEAASGSGSAFDATPTESPTVEASSGTGSAVDASSSVEAGMNVGSGVGESMNAVPVVAASAELVSGTGEALDGDPEIAVTTEASADAATGTSVASDATTTEATGSSAGSGSGSSSDGSSSIAVYPLDDDAGAFDLEFFDPDYFASGAYGRAYGATISNDLDTNASAGSAVGTGSALGLSASVAPGGSAGTGSGSAGSPSDSVLASTASASGAGSSYDATVSTAAATSASAEAASGSGSSLGATTIVQSGVGVASGTGTASTATPGVRASAGHASGTGAGSSSTVLIGAAPRAGLASGTGSGSGVGPGATGSGGLAGTTGGSGMGSGGAGTGLGSGGSGDDALPPTIFSVSGGSFGYVQQQAGVVHSFDGDFVAETVGPFDATQAKYSGVAEKITSHEDSPAQWDDSEVYGPSYPYGVYRGRSAAIHVYGIAGIRTPPTPIPACKCCEEEGRDTTLVALGDCEDECDSPAAIVGVTQTWNSRSWNSAATHKQERQRGPFLDVETWERSIGYPPFTSPLLYPEGQHYALAHVGLPDVDPLILESNEQFARHYLRHTAPAGATHAVLKLRVYGQESQMYQSDLDDLGLDVKPIPWEIRSWSGDDWSFSATGAEAQLAYQRADAGTLIASGEVIPTGGDRPSALPPIGTGYVLGDQDNDLVEVVIPVDIDGMIRFCMLIPETLGRFNAVDLHDPGSPGSSHRGVLGSRWPGFALDPDEPLDIVDAPVFPDIDDQRLANGRVRMAKQGTNFWTSDQYQLIFYDGDPGDVSAVCNDCPECEDPGNPGFPIPDFEPGYLPTFRRQIGDPTTSLDSFICTLESAAMVLDWHTRGAVKVWGGELIPWCGRTESQIVGVGTNLSNAAQAWTHWGQILDIRSGQTWSDLMACLSEGRAVVLQGDYGEFSLAERCQDNFVDNHAISVYPYQNADRLLVGDPICLDFKGFMESSLQAYAEALGAATFGVMSPQKILFAVSRPWTP